MEASRSLSAFFPAAQTQFTLQCSQQQALRKQRERREKEIRLQIQLELTCQRQRDAHTRNQELLRDFRRLEEELSLLTARTDSFRRKQENYKKQLHTFISAPSQLDAHNNAATTVDRSYAMQFYYVPEACGAYDPGHISASMGHVNQAPARPGLCTNHHCRVQQVHQADRPSCVAAYTQTSPVSTSRAYLSSVSPPARDDHARKNMHIKLRDKETLFKAAVEQNMGKYTSTKELGYIAQPKVENHETPISLRSGNIPQALTGIMEIIQNYPMHYQSDHEKTNGTSGDKNVSEETIVQPDQKLACPEVDLNEHGKEGGLGFLVTVLKKSSEEFRKSDEEASMISKDSEDGEDDKSGKCRASEHESGQENPGISLGLSLKKKDDTSSSIHSDCGKGQQQKAQKLYKTMTLQDSTSYEDASLVVKKGKVEELLNSDMSESEVSDFEMQEREGEGKNMEITQPNCAEIKITEDRETDDIERERFSEMLLREIEVGSSDDEREGEGVSGAESSSHEVIGVVIAKRRNTQGKVNTNEEGDGQDSISEVGETSTEDDQANHLISKAEGVCGGSNEEKINAEANKENKLAKKRGDKSKLNAGSESGTVSEEDPPNDAVRLEDKRSDGEDTDVSDELNSSEEDSDFYGHEGRDLNLEMMNMNIHQQSSNQGDSPEEVNSDVSSREEESLHSPVPDMSSVSSQNAIEEEDKDSQRKDIKLHSSQSDVAAFSSQEESDNEEEEDTHREREVGRAQSSPEPDVVAFSSQDVTEDEEDDTENQREKVRLQSPEPVDVVSCTSQLVMEDEEEDRDRQREQQDRPISPEPGDQLPIAFMSSWFCCLKRCSLPQICQRDKESKCNRFHEDGYMDMVQMHPVESSCMVPTEQTPPCSPGTATTVPSIHSDIQSSRH
ncbi:protein starmaker-like isoform X3 [Hyperolius riggenbachi]|uniref:protein starmaker-like isoform X3 n=1 Tax=Hyperolius riggenbachi TaxID=752182 RepID=UPI0035A3D18C